METVKANLNSDFTAVVRDEYGIHILKCKIIDEHKLLFQMFNKTKNIVLPCYEIQADYGMLKYCKPNSIQKQIEKSLSLTSSVNRRRLLSYYSHFKLGALINAYHKF